MFILSIKGVYSRAVVKLLGSKLRYFDRLCAYQAAVFLLQQYEAAKYTARSELWSRVYATFVKNREDLVNGKTNPYSCGFSKIGCECQRTFGLPSIFFLPRHEWRGNMTKLPVLIKSNDKWGLLKQNRISIGLGDLHTPRALWFSEGAQVPFNLKRTGNLTQIKVYF